MKDLENHVALAAEQSREVRSSTAAHKKLTKQFEFLDRLRESGATNMYGASPYLETAFNLKFRAGTPILRQWMETFDGKSTAADRARAAIAKATGAA